MDISTIITTLGFVRTAAGALINERDAQKAASLKVELTEKILDAQVQLAQVLGAVIEKDAVIQRLAERNRELEAAQREKERYSLAAVGLGAFAYALRPAAELTERANEPPHFVCQVCFDAGRKSVLHSSGDGRYLVCKLDQSHILKMAEEHIPTRSVISRGHDPYGY
ncbi:MAG: hypothetical protein ACOZD0_04470 [Pseudomonadota bacterium]